MKTPSANQSTRTNVLHIAGASRSGSTLLELLIGAMPGVVVMGEIRYLWERGFQSNQLCACGSSFRECPFWAAAVTKLTGDRPDFDPARGAELADGVARSRHLPLFALRNPPRAFLGRLCEYRDYLSTVFRCALELAGGDLVVDSSKHIHGLTMVRDPGIDLHVIHMVRDPRAVAFSWARRKVYEQGPDETQMFPRYGPLTSTIHWLVHNAAAELLRARVPGDRYLRVRYEDLARDPASTLALVAGFLARPVNDDLLQADGSFYPAEQHSISGNPVRFGKQQKRIVLDEEWRRSMGWPARTFVSALSWPARARYGYPLRAA